MSERPKTGVFAALFTLIVTFFFVLLWTNMFLESVLGNSERITVSLVIALIAGYFIWKGSSSKFFIRYILRMGLIIGGIGFCLGFFIPIIMGGQPFLGIFITGPLGFFIGVIGGAMNWRFFKKPPSC